jgi:hypothetical protein
MKKLLLHVLFITAIISCNKEPDDLKYLKMVPGGCAAEKGASVKNALTSDIDKVSYTMTNGNLDILVGFNATCCGQYSSTTDIKGDTISIKINTTQAGLCNCICYYTYDFIFTGSGTNYNYLATVDDKLTFTGKINP